MKRTLGLVQARMSSSRLPGKVLQPLAGVPLIAFMVERARRAQTLDEVVVVTSTDVSDDPLVRALDEHGIPSFRGHLTDVLARYKHAADRFGATEVVRLTGDCPLIDPAIVDRVVASRNDTGADYASNIDPPTFPDGFDVECFSMQALECAFREAALPAEREHVTLWMRAATSGLRRHNVSAIADLSHLRLTVDYQDDLDVVRRVVASCGSGGGRLGCDLFDVLRCLTYFPEIMKMNSHVRNEALAQSSSTP